MGAHTWYTLIISHRRPGYRINVRFETINK